MKHYYKEVFGDLDKVEESDANPEVLYDRNVKEGKTEVEAVPLEEDASVSLSQSVLEFDAEGGTATIEVYSKSLLPYQWR